MTTKKEQGFSLVECVIAMVLLTVGFMGICGLLTTCVKQETLSTNLATANSLARSKMEELKVVTRTVGGSLTSDVSGYSDSPTSSVTRRWQIASDVASTQVVTVTVLQVNQGAAVPQVQITTRMF